MTFNVSVNTWKPIKQPDVLQSHFIILSGAVAQASFDFSLDGVCDYPRHLMLTYILQGAECTRTARKDPIMPFFKMQLLEICLIFLGIVLYALYPDASMEEIHVDHVPIDTLLLCELF